jgi:hypothetical protein
VEIGGSLALGLDGVKTSNLEALANALRDLQPGQKSNLREKHGLAVCLLLAIAQWP